MHLQALYRAYSVKQRRPFLKCFVVTSLLYDVYCLIVPFEQELINRGLTALFLAANLCLLFVSLRARRRFVWTTLPHLAWHAANLQILARLFLGRDLTPRDDLGWVLLLEYLIYVTLPLSLRYCLVLALGTFATYVVCLFGLLKSDGNLEFQVCEKRAWVPILTAYREDEKVEVEPVALEADAPLSSQQTLIELLHQRSPHKWCTTRLPDGCLMAMDVSLEDHSIRKRIVIDGAMKTLIAANTLLMVGANLLGLTSSYLEDVQQKKAFLDTKQCLEMKLIIEEQSDEQERLLLSVLPEHVAVKMRQDLGSALDTQFKKIYMSRHENVSILYADIVGFTAISSTYSASELVKILNELFARFDRLSERYEQLRIKILGDCYYCISGAPRERPDHAYLCIHMGLSMVKAIKYVQQKTNSPVDMRVGIHTGAVLAGVLGQRQWQFDVYSKDVELANKMESSGLPGKVHISEKTLKFLNGEFEVEPGFGEKREESLRMAGLKTYFITKVNKPFKGDVMKNGTVHEEPLEDNLDDTAGVVTPIEEKNAAAVNRERENSDDFRQRLRKDLMSRTGWRSVVSHIDWLTLSFKDKQKEYSYRHNAESFSSVSLVGCPLTLIVISIAQMIVLPRDTLSMVSFGVTLFALTFLVLFAVIEQFPKYFLQSLETASKRMNHSLLGRCVFASICIVILATGNVVDTIGCAQLYNIKQVNCTSELDMTTECLYPSYFSHMTVMVLIASVVPIQPLFVAKVFIPTFIVLFGILTNVAFLWDLLVREDIISHRHCFSFTPAVLAVSLTMLLSHFGLILLARVMEVGSRVLFLWKNEAEEQRERACDIRRKNEALVHNILPPHVAVHFLGNKKRQHEELYSQSYSEVGVLFASMPNFSDFYSEESVNNQGLECLRFLNEVISDFDALLELKKFQDVIKIKTIGSTYMAASGLNPQVSPKDDSITSRWLHLSLLVEFAFEMRKALQSINEQSFNHFVLKMGVNHGPITAGVIGARKPHYDIWGNTVNVASRMESTGKAGYIQVTEETSEILKNFGYVFEQRGLVAVKGKGQLMTYYLVGKGGDSAPHQHIPVEPSAPTTELAEIAEETEPSDQAALLSDEQ